MKVLLFARARDLAGTDAIDIALPAGATIADLRRLLAERCPKLAPLVAKSAFAVDDEFAKDETALSDATIVALLPPVSGG